MSPEHVGSYFTFGPLLKSSDDNNRRYVRHTPSLRTFLVLTVIVSIASSIPACPTKTCAPCYITAAPYELTYPGIGIAIQNETYTLNVTPHVTEFPNGSVSTIYETEKRNFSTALNGNGSDFSLQLEEAYTWIVPGIGDRNLTL